MAIEDAAALRALGVSSGLPDAALDIILGAANADVERALPSVMRELLRRPMGERVMLSQPVDPDAIVSVKEVGSGQVSSTLAEDDYEVLGQRTLRRLATGTNPAYRWLGQVDVEYGSGITEDERDRAVLAVVKLDLTHAPGLAGQSIAQWSEQYMAGRGLYADERQSLLTSVGGTEPLLV